MFPVFLLKENVIYVIYFEIRIFIHTLITKCYKQQQSQNAKSLEAFSK